VHSIPQDDSGFDFVEVRYSTGNNLFAAAKYSLAIELIWFLGGLFQSLAIACTTLFTAAVAADTWLLFGGP
jgi:hypothetical protein